MERIEGPSVTFELPCPNGSHSLTFTGQLWKDEQTANMAYKLACSLCQKEFQAKNVPAFMEFLRGLQEAFIDQGHSGSNTVYADGEPVYGEDYSVETFLKQHDRAQ